MEINTKGKNDKMTLTVATAECFTHGIIARKSMLVHRDTKENSVARFKVRNSEKPSRRSDTSLRNVHPNFKCA